MLELEHGFRVVDAHIQLEPDESRRPRDIGAPEQIVREMHQAGIVEALVYPAKREGSYLRVNNAVARLAVDRPFVAFARINGILEPGTRKGSRLRNVVRSRGNDHTSPEDVEQYAYEERFEGFVLDPATDGVPDHEVLSALEEVGRPVVTYGGHGFPPSTIEETLLEHDFPLIIAHCGGYPLDEDLTNETINLLDSYESCFVDTSFVRFRDPLERAVMEHPDRVIFGSGTPAAHPNVGVMEVLTLDVPEDAMRKVFWKNLARVMEPLAP